MHQEPYGLCARQIKGEPSPNVIGVSMDGCQQEAQVCDGNVVLFGAGRVITVHVCLRQVCPGHKIALAVSLTEDMGCCQEEKRGMKVLLLPPFCGTQCRDLIIRDIQFVLPELPICCGQSSQCRARQFRLRTIANYADTGFSCCE